MTVDAHLSDRLRDLYDKYRTALLNRKYYGARLVLFQRWNLTMEIVIAVGSSSAIAAWAIWREGSGATTWAVLTGVAALFAVVKPLLQLSRQVERYSKLYYGHGDVAVDFGMLADDAHRSKKFTPEMERTYRQALQRFRLLSPQDDPKPDKQLLRKCYDEVNAEVPPENFWMPEEVMQ